MVIFKTSPSLRGSVNPHSILQKEGTLLFFTFKELLLKDGLFFQLISDNFKFEFYVQNLIVVVKRNEAYCKINAEHFENKKLMIALTWDSTHLSLNLLQDKKNCIEKIPTEPCAPPSSLITWAKKQNLLQQEQYETEEDFMMKVSSCLDSVQKKINEAGAVNQFWDFKYKGNKIISKKPKREIDIQPIIHGYLLDQMLCSSIEICHEVKTGVGNIDYTFIAKIQNKGISSICVEFKNAHSSDLIKGLTTQLPQYMTNKNAKYGIYCVLDYGKEYPRKCEINKDSTDIVLFFEILKSKNPILKNINIQIFTLSKPKSASK